MRHHPAHVPQFGNWEANDEMPVTVIFDNARAEKGEEKKLNPNNPAENPAASGLNPNNVSGSEDFDEAQFKSSKLRPVVDTGAPARQGENGHGKFNMNGVDLSKRTSTATSGKENLSAAENSRKGLVAVSRRDNAGPGDSPNHQMYGGRLGNRPGSPYQNPSDVGNANSSSTPGKSRLRGSSRADETPDRSAALPKFGAWDENDPSAGESFTAIFNQHRNEKKQGGPNRIPTLQRDHPSKLNHADKRVQGSQKHTKFSFWICCRKSSASD